MGEALRGLGDRAGDVSQRVAADSIARVGGRVRLLVDEQPQLG